MKYMHNNLGFDTCLRTILELEGIKYTNLPGDLGGATCAGVTQQTFNTYLQHNNMPTQDVKTITPQQISNVYKTEFYDKIKCGNYKSPFNLLLFDACVHSGQGKAQEFLNQITHLTPEQKDCYVLLALRFIQLNATAEVPSQKQWLKGWMSRLSKLAKAAEL